jgi:hypothetical protein
MRFSHLQIVDHKGYDFGVEYSCQVYIIFHVTWLLSVNYSNTISTFTVVVLKKNTKSFVFWILYELCRRICTNLHEAILLGKQVNRKNNFADCFLFSKTGKIVLIDMF